MTLINNVDIKCPKCGTVFNAPYYQSVNVTLDPELKNKVLENSINIFECPNCKLSPIILPEPFAYHDMQRRLYLTLYPESSILKWPEYELGTLLQNKKLQEVFKSQDKKIFDFKTRIVFGWAYLLEKIRIFDSDLDDCSIEMLKVRVLQEMKRDDIIYFIFLQYNSDSGVLDFVVIEDSQWRQWSFPLDTYTAISEIYKEESLRIKSGFFIDFRRYTGPLSENRKEIQNQFKNFKPDSWV
jgi:hypothetical protein